MVNVDVYSIEVEEPHTFLVADNSYFAKNKNHHLFVAHNGLAELSLGVSLAFDSTPASVSFVDTTITACGLGVKFSRYGWTAGATVGLGYLTYELFFKNKDNKQQSFYIERANKDANTNGNDPEDPKDKKNRKIPPPPPLGNKNDKNKENKNFKKWRISKGQTNK